MEENKPYTVSNYIELINSTLEGLFADIIGEISELKIASSGHIYLTLKDKDTGYILPCTIWKRDYDLIAIKLEVGMEILVRGKPDFYGPFGKLSFIAKHAELVGEGALKKAYDELKKKLTSEGLFEQSRKKPIPLFPQKIGVITSLHGAVIHDFSNNLKKFGFKVKIVDSKVEGPESGKFLTLAVRYFKKQDIDVLVLIRGGGSMQSLAGFDNEALVREISSFPVPVITGIGHHKDIPLATLVSDASESTPSLVATLLNKSWEEAVYSIDKKQSNILNIYSNWLENFSQKIESSFRKINSFLNNIIEKHKKAKELLRNATGRISLQIRLDRKKLIGIQTDILSGFKSTTEMIRIDKIPNTGKRIIELCLRGCKKISDKIKDISKLIESNDPDKLLKLGYSIISNSKGIIKSIKDIKIGENIEINVFDGKILSEVKNINK
ncbi:MAG: exodeoxyribonuclease VII large subunit [Candidatus Paceibacterota bacterium]|jgi:exodeoxyribonuclease VII large subunit